MTPEQQRSHERPKAYKIEIKHDPVTPRPITDPDQLLEAPEEQERIEAPHHEALPEHGTPGAPVATGQPSRPNVVEASKQNVAPVAPVDRVDPAQAPVSQPHVGAGVYILQWLSYAFWLGFAAACSVLFGILIATALGNVSSYNSVSESIVYPLAAAVVLIVAALVCDMLYARREPGHKRRVASAILIVHAVPAILAMVGGLVMAVYAVIKLLIGGLGEMDAMKTVCFTSLVVAVLFAIVSVRMLMGGPRKLIRIVTRGALVAMAVVGVLWACIGPVSEGLATRQDRMIEQVLPTISTQVTSYAQKNSKLPATLSDIKGELGADASYAISNNLVTYRPNTIPASQPNAPEANGTTGSNKSTTQPIASTSPQPAKYYYQLCTTYQRASTDTRVFDYRPTQMASSNAVPKNPSDYNGQLAVYGMTHGAGQVCYNLYAVSYARTN